MSPNRTLSAPTSALVDVERAVLDRRTELLAFWERTPTADRIFAVERLLREDTLRADDEDALLAVHGAVRTAWAGARAAKIAGAGLAQKRHELDLAVAERKLSQLLSERGLFDALFMAAESVLRVVPRAPGEDSFKELVHRRDELRRRKLNILSPATEAA